METFLNDTVVLFVILLLGYLIGKISYKGFSFGHSGVLLIALFIGHLGFVVSRSIMDLGIILYVYAVGMSVGPRLFRSFRKKGWKYIFIGVSGPVIGALVVLGAVYLMKIPQELSTGLFTGTLTSTPALAKALDLLSRIAPEKMTKVSSSYSIIYPFSMIIVALLVQMIPKISHANLKKEAEEYNDFEKADLFSLEIMHFRVCNPGCIGKTIAEINPSRMIQANISRVFREDGLIPVNSHLVIREGDILRSVGTREELEKMATLLGEKVTGYPIVPNDPTQLDVKILNKHYIGKKICEILLWEEYGLVLTRLHRSEIELSPRGGLTLEYGDMVRLVGTHENLVQASQELQGNIKQMEETNLSSYFLGLLIGIMVGAIPIRLSPSIAINLGSAGGTFLVSIFLGHFGRIRSIPFFVPQPVKYFSKEFGLLLFLAGAGTMSGSKIVPILQSYGITLLFVGIAIILLTIAIFILFVHKVLSLSIAASMGALSAVTTNPPALSSAQSSTDSIEPMVCYASIYPVALITKIIIAQIFVLFFS